jgi:hypothetical protein
LEQDVAGIRHILHIADSDVAASRAGRLDGAALIDHDEAKVIAASRGLAIIFADSAIAFGAHMRTFGTHCHRTGRKAHLRPFHVRLVHAFQPSCNERRRSVGIFGDRPPDHGEKVRARIQVFHRFSPARKNLERHLRTEDISLPAADAVKSHRVENTRVSQPLTW